MTTLRVSLAELLGRETAADGAARQDEEYWYEDRPRLRQRLSDHPTAVERALDRAGLPRCNRRAIVVADHGLVSSAGCTRWDIPVRRSRCTVSVWRWRCGRLRPAVNGKDGTGDKVQ